MKLKYLTNKCYENYYNHLLYENSEKLNYHKLMCCQQHNIITIRVRYWYGTV